MAEAMKLLADNDELREQMGKSAQKLVSSVHSWEARGRSLIEIYEKIAFASV